MKKKTPKGLEQFETLYERWLNVVSAIRRPVAKKPNVTHTSKKDYTRKKKHKKLDIE
jgi:hypothetical protein